MTVDELLGEEQRLEEYLSLFDMFLPRKELRGLFRVFVKGQLGPIKRKSLEPIADAAGIESRRLQQLFSRYGWDEGGMRDELQRMAREVMPEDRLDTVLVIDDTSDGKKGTHTAGVARQWCGSLGKVDNCIVEVFLGCYGGGLHVLLDGELFLPEEWDANPADAEVARRRKEAGVPDGVGHVPKSVMALAQVRRALGNGMNARWAVADSFYGAKPAFLRELDGMGLWYAAELPVSHRVWAARPETRIPERREGRGRPATAVRHEPRPLAVRDVAAKAWGDVPWKPHIVHDSGNGPSLWEVKAGKVWARGEDGRPEERWLVVARNPLGGETKHIVSNAAPGVPLEKLLEVFFERWRVETCFHDCKEELGLDHAEIRSHRGIGRHLILTIISFFFLQTRVRELQKKRGTDGLPAGRRDAAAA